MAELGAGAGPSQGDVDRRTEETGPSLMLDPSLLLSMRTLPVIADLARRNELRGAVIPRSFFQVLEERGLNVNVSRFFGGPTGEREYGRLADILPQVRELREYQSRGAPIPEVTETEIMPVITRQIGAPEVAKILVEEWAFLTAQSWIVSRIKRPFSAFVKAGAFAIEGSRDSFDKLVARTLKKPASDLPIGLAYGDRLRAIAKWVAVGGPSAASFLFHPILFPPMVALTGIVSGYFLLFDP